ncbi:MAG: hypothetical protein GY861_02960 [bacterium]|nr:hypothetical protein [bacterium]
MEIKLDGKYTTRDGRPVRIYAVDENNFHRVHGAYLDNGVWFQYSWTKGGLNHVSHGDTWIDLVPSKKKGWINVVDHPIGDAVTRVFCSEKEANTHKTEIAIDTIEIEYNGG